MSATIKSFVVVGDIHGDSERLARLLSELNGREERIIFLGDYVNRGPDSMGVIDLLITFRQQNPNTCFLLGNHDYFFLKYLEGANSFRAFAEIGGLATIKSYVEGRINRDVRLHLWDSVPPIHKTFLSDLVLFWENNDFLVSHAGFDPHYPDRRDIESMVLTYHGEILSYRNQLGKTAIFGHYVQKSGKPFLSPYAICLDTGCGFSNGVLTAMELPERICLSF